MPDVNTHVVVGALREGVDFSDCAVAWTPDMSFQDGELFHTVNVQGKLELVCNETQYLYIPIVWDEKTAVVSETVDEASVETPLEEYCLNNAFQFSVRPDGIVSMIAGDELPSVDITIPMLVDGDQLDSITFAPTDLMSGSTTLTLDSNADDQGGLG